MRSQISFADLSVLVTNEMMDNVTIWDRKALAFVRADGVPVPRTRLVATGSMASSFIFRLSGNSVSITISHLNLGGGG